MLILGIETSCDETAVALYDMERGLIAHTLKSQIDLHALMEVSCLKLHLETT